MTRLHRVRWSLVAAAAVVASLGMHTCNHYGIGSFFLYFCAPLLAQLSLPEAVALNLRVSPLVGDESLDPEIELVNRTAIGQLVEAVDGGDVELFRPPQGGKVFLIAARVRNMDSCQLSIQGALRDPETGRIIGNDVRPFPNRVNDDGAIEPLSPPSLSSWANVPACPSQAAERNVNDELYEACQACHVNYRPGYRRRP